MIKTPLSTVIGGAFWTPGCTVIGGASKTFNQIIKPLFANNEQGFAYDPNDLSTMYQDAAGTVPVTAVGQPVGLMLDKSKGMVLSPNLVKPVADVVSSGVEKVGDATYRIVTTGEIRYFSYTSIPVGAIEIEYEILQSSAGNIRIDSSIEPHIISSQVGRRKAILYNTREGAAFTRNATPTNVTIKVHSIRQILGNHAYQTTSAARPILQDVPHRIDFDAVDDKLITSLPAQLTGCTVVRAIPNVGTQILTNQTIATPYNDSTDHCGLIVINRALTATETSQITQLFNKAAGV